MKKVRRHRIWLIAKFLYAFQNTFTRLKQYPDDRASLREVTTETPRSSGKIFHPYRHKTEYVNPEAAHMSSENTRNLVLSLGRLAKPSQSWHHLCISSPCTKPPPSCPSKTLQPSKPHFSATARQPSANNTYQAHAIVIGGIGRGFLRGTPRAVPVVRSVLLREARDTDALLLDIERECESIFSLCRVLRLL